MKTIIAQSGHTLFLNKITYKELTQAIKDAGDAKDYKEFWEVRNWDKDGHVFFYLAKGYAPAPKEIVVFYPKGEMWSSYGKTFQEAIDGAQKDGWKYA